MGCCSMHELLMKTIRSSNFSVELVFNRSAQASPMASISFRINSKVVTMAVLIHSGCYKRTIDQVACKQQKFNSHISVAEVQGQGDSMVEFRNSLPGCRLLTSHIVGWVRDPSGIFHKGINPIHEGSTLMT